MRFVLPGVLVLCCGLILGWVGGRFSSAITPERQPSVSTSGYGTELDLANGPAPLAEDLVQLEPLTLKGEIDLFYGVPARNADGTVNVIVEIPAGTNSKWEVDKDGLMKLEVREGSPRAVKFLPYPGNYGMIPSTKLPKEEGGDGDALDVLILCPTLRRGTVAKVHVIGVLKYLDRGEQDDKLLAVMDSTPLGSVRSLKELNESFPEASNIVKLWFDSYKGPGKMEFKGWGEAKEAQELLDKAIEAKSR